MIKFFKVQYPTKQTINLVKQEVDQVKLKKQIIGLVVCSICFILFVKLAVIDRFKAAEQAKSTYLATVEQIQLLEESMKEHSELQELYDKLNNTFLSTSEAGEIDRIEIMNIVEQCIFDKANIESIYIEENQVITTVIDTTLETVSEIVAALEENEKVVYVTVFTAETGSVEKDNGKVSADIMVQLKSEGDKDE